MIFLEEALIKFGELDPEVVFVVNSERFTDKIIELSQKYDTDLNSAVLLAVVGEIPEEQDLVEYLAQENQLEEKTAKIVAKELNETVLLPMTKRLLFLSADPDRDKESIRLEKEHLREIFSSNILSEFKESPFIKNALNFKIFDLLERDFSLKQALEKGLYENQEVLAPTKIKVRNQEVPATVGNWLKDFIAKKGNDDFTVVDLSDYLANSENTKKLTEQEKKQLGELLFLYRNLRFFEAMTADRPIDDWRIFTFDLGELKAQNNKKETTKQEAPEPDLKQKLANYDWDKIKGLERRALLEELGVSKQEFERWYNVNKL